jgi:methylmalonyl-CoA mutase
MLTRREPYSNVLRTTIAVAAAGLGGADAITALPHTATLGLPDAFARRVARNMQLILLQESSLAQVADPGAGSGAFESLTEQLCLAGWGQFQEIERAGGAWQALQTGLIQENVAAVRAARQQAIARGEDILTGTNAFPDIAELPAAVLDVAPRAATSEEPADITAAALPRLRLAEPFEALRDKSDQILAATGVRPKVFLAALGAPAELSSALNFAKNFFEVGGIETVSGAVDDDEATQRQFACLCASSKLAEMELAAAVGALRANGARHIYFVGRPGAQENALRQAGVQTFIHEGCDALATLNAAYDILQRQGR